MAGKLTACTVGWVVRRPGGLVGHRSPGEGLCRALCTAAGTWRLARVRRQLVVPQAGRRRVGAQGERLLQAGAPRQGQRPASRQPLASSRARKILPIQIGRQAFGVARPAAGQARVQPGAMSPAGKGSGLVVSNRKAVGPRVREEAQARRGEAGLVPRFQIPDHPERRVVCKGDVLWRDTVVCRAGGGAWAADMAGLLAHRAHGLIVLFRQVVVTVQVPAPGQNWCQNQTRCKQHFCSGCARLCLSGDE